MQHKEIGKIAWSSPDGKTHTQIDHIIINSKWKNSPSDKEVQRKVDVWSDHQLLMATLSIKLQKT